MINVCKSQLYCRNFESLTYFFVKNSHGIAAELSFHEWDEVDFKESCTQIADANAAEAESLLGIATVAMWDVT